MHIENNARTAMVNSDIPTIEHVNAFRVGGTRKVRDRTIAITGTTVTRPDGSTYYIPRVKSRAGAKRKTTKVMREVKVIEAARIHLQHDYNEG